VDTAHGLITHLHRSWLATPCVLTIKPTGSIMSSESSRGGRDCRLTVGNGR
jgi:hypothetical protein